uniref:Polynucleotide kinase 3 phosphatase n=1 Tax=Mimivirus LCMiAC01 TaxID=2506608 RepID=A0A481YYW0_9VIRU|nr:MAG: polynucleotide kinase 3 phosphatase [Mimivirus LCMiAC01]
MEWIVDDNYLYGKYGTIKKFKKKTKIAAFDLDYTIVRPTGGKKFSDSDNDWIFFNDSVKPKILNYYENDYTIIIMSNQKGISSGKVNMKTWQKKIGNIANALTIPFVILASLRNDLYRKPRTSLWDKFILCDKKKSFYCGDAGGLPKRTINGRTIKKDFSDSDLKFALNVGIKFMHRDEFIYGHVSKMPLVNMNYPHYMDHNIGKRREPNMESKSSIKKFEPYKKQEIIINVGYPGSGKSYYTKKYIVPNNYVYINRDTLKTTIKCIKLCERALKEGKCVVIDNTNPSIEVRKRYIDIAKKYKVFVRCIWFTTSYELSMHNNIYRNSVTNGNTRIVPRVGYNIYRKKFEKPKKKEGIRKIIKKNFTLDVNNVNDKYYHFLY